MSIVNAFGDAQLIANVQKIIQEEEIKLKERLALL
jgi:hypothetical protein